MSTTFATTTHGTDATQAVVDVAAKLVDGFRTTGRTSVKSERHMLIDVEVEMTDPNADRNDCWVMLTSYGMSPSADLGSRWEGVFAGLVDA